MCEGSPCLEEPRPPPWPHGSPESFIPCPHAPAPVEKWHSLSPPQARAPLEAPHPAAPGPDLRPAEGHPHPAGDSTGIVGLLPALLWGWSPHPLTVPQAPLHSRVPLPFLRTSASPAGLPATPHHPTWGESQHSPQPYHLATRHLPYPGPPQPEGSAWAAWGCATRLCTATRAHSWGLSAPCLLSPHLSALPQSLGLNPAGSGCSAPLSSGSVQRSTCLSFPNIPQTHLAANHDPGTSNPAAEVLLKTYVNPGPRHSRNQPLKAWVLQPNPPSRQREGGSLTGDCWRGP